MKPSAAAIIQAKYNEENNITPETIKKSISNVLGSIYEADYVTDAGGRQRQSHSG